MSERIIIRFNDLDIGSHNYDFELDKEFFESFDHHEFIDNNLKVKVELLKDSRLITLIVGVEGSIDVECDRCLDTLTIPIKLEETFFVKEEKIGNIDEDESMIYVSKDDNEIDLSTQVFDIVVLSLPMRKVHTDDENGESTCNPEQLDYLSSEEEEKTDPRWEALSKLKK